MCQTLSFKSLLLTTFLLVSTTLASPLINARHPAPGHRKPHHHDSKSSTTTSPQAAATQSLSPANAVLDYDNGISASTLVTDANGEIIPCGVGLYPCPGITSSLGDAVQDEMIPGSLANPSVLPSPVYPSVNPPVHSSLVHPASVDPSPIIAPVDLPPPLNPATVLPSSVIPAPVNPSAIPPPPPPVAIPHPTNIAFNPYPKFEPPLEMLTGTPFFTPPTRQPGFLPSRQDEAEKENEE